MQTNFSTDQLRESGVAESEAAIRKCVHCGFCLATCPTYVLLGDERDSPRGRIYLMKDMLENERPPTAEIVKHVDRCLSCLSCMSTCPSGVNYMHLVDHTRAYIRTRYKRPLHDRVVRAALAWVLPHRTRLRWALRLAGLGHPFLWLFDKIPVLAGVAAMLRLAPRQGATPIDFVTRSPESPKGRVGIFGACAEDVLRPSVRAATINLIHRAGYETVVLPDPGCCGALLHHMGNADEGLAAARHTVDAWANLIRTKQISAIIMTVSGCGSMIKEYGHLLRNDADYSASAQLVSAHAKDITEWLAAVGLPATDCKNVVVAYHPACSLQHGQKIVDAPINLLREAGFEVRVPREAHLCCGSAGVYNILQPHIASALRDRKLDHIARLDAHVIATGNVGCAMQLRASAPIPVVHTVELLAWAAGGPKPAELRLE